MSQSSTFIVLYVQIHQNRERDLYLAYNCRIRASVQAIGVCMTALPVTFNLLKVTSCYNKISKRPFPACTIDLEGSDATALSCTNARLESEYLEQAVLPVRMRGLSIRFKKVIAFPVQVFKFAFPALESGLWLQALPTPTLGTLLDPETFREAIAVRVVSDVYVPIRVAVVD